jgi:FKBP-type peptidyl-prolyl cis-trans isomerase
MTRTWKAMTRTWRPVLALGAVLAALSCGGDNAADAPDAAPSEALAPAPDFAPELELAAMTETASGLRYLDLVPGEGGEATAGQTVTVHYTGWLLDGPKFDSSRDRNEPFVFPLGQSRVIRGWDEGVAGMRVGGQRRLVIPPELGYGDAGAGSLIPPGATLVFDVELLGVRGE